MPRVNEVIGEPIDVSSSLRELARSADLIVVATVTGQTQYSPVSIAHKLAVSHVVKGQVPTDLTVYQSGVLGEASTVDERLAVGRQYFLFLGRQEDSSPNTYYIIGGDDGVFTVVNGELKGKPKFTRDVRRSADPFSALEEAVRQSLR